MPRERRRGSQILEFTLAAIPLIFLSIGIFGVGIGMWGYHSVAAGVKSAARIASVRGAGCAGQPCATTIRYYARMMLSSGVPRASRVTFTSAGGSQTCDPLRDCVDGDADDDTVWPSLPGTTVGSDITISATFPLQAVLPMLTIAGTATIGSETFGATSQQMVLF
jgi:Flp pilus assembly protein TadG